MISFPYRLAHLWSLLWGQLHQNAAGVAFAWFFIGGQSKACETRKADDADPEREHGFPSGCKRLSRSHVHLASKFCQVSMPASCLNITGLPPKFLFIKISKAENRLLRSLKNTNEIRYSWWIELEPSQLCKQYAWSFHSSDLLDWLHATHI